MLDNDDLANSENGFDMAELSDLLAELPNDGWVVERTLSESQYETTQLVHRDNAVVENVFVRKVFASGSGLGAAYQRVFAAQAAGVRFAHLPLVYDMVETENGVAVITEFLNGQTLHQYVKSQGPGVKIAAAVGRDLCDAMRELHESFEAPIVHRDLKPSNIMIANGRLVLIDLGIARAYRTGAERDTVRLGTPGYAPPEQFGYGQTMPQSDIYAAGMVVAFCLTGESPSPKLRESGFDDPRIPNALRPVLMKATALDAAHRYASARDLASALDLALSEMRSSSAIAFKGGAYAPPTPISVPAFGGGASTPSAPIVVPAPVSAAAPGTSRGNMSSSSSWASVALPSEMPPGASSATPRGGPPESSPGKVVYGVTGAFSDAPSSPPSENAGSTGIARLTSIIGIVWNVLLCMGWALLTIASLSASVRGGNEFLDALPMWGRFMLYFGWVIIPAALLVVMLADKRRLKHRIPVLARVSGKRLVAICLGSILALYCVTFLVYFVLFAAR